MTEQNNGREKRRFGRRAWTGFITVILSTVAYYVCMFKGMDLSWFAEYAKTLLYILGFITGTLTITDAIQSWRVNNGAAKLLPPNQE